MKSRLHNPMAAACEEGPMIPPACHGECVNLMKNTPLPVHGSHAIAALQYRRFRS
jgi:hypothetical protein